MKNKKGVRKLGKKCQINRDFLPFKVSYFTLFAGKMADCSGVGTRGARGATAPHMQICGMRFGLLQ